MKKIYTEEHKDFFLAFIPGHTDVEVAEEFNRRFSIKITPAKVHSYKRNNKIRSGTQKGVPKGSGSIFTSEIRVFIRANNEGKTAVQMTELLNSTFGTKYTTGQIKAVRSRMRIKSGLSGHFEKGHVPANKGRKGVCAKGCEKSWFKKGIIPHNQMSVGSEAVTTDGYLKVKIAEPNVWRFKHIMEWETHFGKVPSGCMISFRDGNKRNCSIENLMCISKLENSVLNRMGLRSSDVELTESGLALAKLKLKISKISKLQKQREAAR